MRIQIRFLETEARFPVGFREGFPHARASPYSGFYEVIPRTTRQELPTADRYLDRNVVVQPIPFHEVENTERGTTAIIGGI